MGQRGEVNDKLRAISEAPAELPGLSWHSLRTFQEAQQLEDQMAYTTVGSPFRYRVRLIKLAGAHQPQGRIGSPARARRARRAHDTTAPLNFRGEAERAGQLMEARIQKLKEALRSAAPGSCALSLPLSSFQCWAG